LMPSRAVDGSLAILWTSRPVYGSDRPVYGPPGPMIDLGGVSWRFRALHGLVGVPAPPGQFMGHRAGLWTSRPFYEPPGSFMRHPDLICTSSRFLVVPAVTGPGDCCRATRGVMDHPAALWATRLLQGLL